MKVLRILFFSLLCFIVQGQELKICGYQGYQKVDEVVSACDLQGANATNASTEKAAMVVDNILDKVGLFRNFLIEQCDDINNALAVTMPLENGDLDRYILYDQDFFSKVSATTGTDWGNTSILAHEVGHHLNGHTLKGSGSNHRVELQADEFSGFVLARMGCSLEGAQSAVSKLLPEEASATHPAKADRLAAIAKGWKRGNGKVIEVKKVEEVAEDEITAEMVLGRYLDAIGGQTKISGIKTMYREYISVLSNFTSSGPELTVKETFLSPQIYLYERKGRGFREKLLYNKNRVYSYDKDFTFSLTNLNVSYFPEYAAILNNYDIKYLGEQKYNGETVYVVEVQNLEFQASYQRQKATYKVIDTRYYSKRTGLLVRMREEGELSYIKNDGSTKIVEKSTKFGKVKSWERYGGVLFPKRIDYWSKADVERNRTYWDEYTQKIQINPKLKPKKFIIKD